MESAESSVILNMYKQVLSVKLKRPECSGVYFYFADGCSFHWASENLMVIC